MVIKPWRRCSLAILCLFCLWSLVARGQVTPNNEWPLVQLADPIRANIVRRTLDDVVRRFDEPKCATLLDNLTDQKGQPLQHHLSSLAPDVRSYVRLVYFVDDLHSGGCSSDTLAVTMPRSRVVHVCAGPRLEETRVRNPEHLVASFIHELLHTLGLGENPPASSWITERVLRVCASKSSTRTSRRRS